MLKLLKEVCKQNKFACIYTNEENTSKFFFARVLCVNEKHIAIYLVTKDGCFDGIVVKRTEEISRVETDGQYSQKMKKLCSLQEQKPWEHCLQEERIPESLLSVAKEEKGIVALEMLKSGYDDVVGFVEEIRDGLCTIRQIDEYGFEDGISYVRIDDISQISYASEDEDRILRLWKLNQ